MLLFLLWPLCLIAVPISAGIPKTLTLATTNWCPYVCPSSDQAPGIAHEYVKAVLEKQGYHVEIKSYPWSRAIKEVEFGRAHGLLTAVHEEAPNFVFTTTPTMVYQVCFFTNVDSSWTFNGVDSLNSISLGVIRDYGYGDLLDEYLRNVTNRSSIQLISGGKEIPRFVNMLRLNRIDAFVSDQYVAQWEVKTHNVDFSNVKNAGCLADTPFYMGFNPNLKWADSLIQILNQAFSDKSNKTILRNILNKYSAN